MAMPLRDNKQWAARAHVEIGARLRVARINAKLTQAQVGARLGVSFQQVQKYERGINRISGAMMFEACRLLKIDPNYLLGWNGAADGIGQLGATAPGMIRAAGAFSKLNPNYQGPLRALFDVLITHQAQKRPIDQDSLAKRKVQ